MYIIIIIINVLSVTPNVFSMERYNNNNNNNNNDDDDDDYIYRPSTTHQYISKGEINHGQTHPLSHVLGDRR